MPDEHEHLGSVPLESPSPMRALRASTIVASLVPIVSGCATGQDKPLPVEAGNYCQDEAIRFVKERVGEDTQIRAS